MTSLHLNTGLLGLALLGVGCGGTHSEKTSGRSTLTAAADTGVPAPSPADAGIKLVALQTAAAREARRIIYTAELTLNVVDFTPASQQISELAERHGGFVANSDVQGSSGARRRGRWTLRAPTGHYRDLLEEAARLGELVSRREDSQDVTEEFVDLEARQRAKQEEETRMLRHLHESTHSLEQILTVERELMRVRTELEQLQGRQRLLADRTALSTLTLIIQETQPFAPEESPALGTRIARTWSGSVGRLQQLGEGGLHVLVAASPWVLTLGPLAALVALPWRHRRRLPG